MKFIEYIRSLHGVRVIKDIRVEVEKKNEFCWEAKAPDLSEVCRGVGITREHAVRSLKIALTTKIRFAEGLLDNTNKPSKFLEKVSQYISR